MPTIGIPSEFQNVRDTSGVKIHRPTQTVENAAGSDSSIVDWSPDDSQTSSTGSKRQADSFNRNKNSKIDTEILNRINGTKNTGIVRKERKTNQMGQDEFLKLLTFQLQNQDPSNPIDDKKITSELAQLSQLEQLTNMKNIMQKQSSGKMLENKFYASSFLGKKVSSNGNSLNIDRDGDDAKIRFVLKSNAPATIIRIFDEKSNMIGQIEKENLAAGANEIIWNGKTLDGQIAGKGKYNFQVLAYGEDYKQVETELKTQGIVTGVEFDGENTILVVDGNRKVDLREVDSFETNDPKTNTRMNSRVGENRNFFPDVNRNKIEAYKQDNDTNANTKGNELIREQSKPFAYAEKRERGIR
ncbi:MAG: hypothetical protein HQK49_16600 [Oligoflexia bacterium]|nr:hypothetical protein [Oligoflexia bacterium]